MLGHSSEGFSVRNCSCKLQFSILGSFLPRSVCLLTLKASIIVILKLPLNQAYHWYTLSPFQYPSLEIWPSNYIFMYIYIHITTYIYVYIYIYYQLSHINISYIVLYRIHPPFSALSHPFLFAHQTPQASFETSFRMLGSKGTVRVRRWKTVAMWPKIKEITLATTKVKNGNIGTGVTFLKWKTWMKKYNKNRIK